MSCVNNRHRRRRPRFDAITEDDAVAEVAKGVVVAVVAFADAVGNAVVVAVAPGAAVAERPSSLGWRAHCSPADGVAVRSAAADGRRGPSPRWSCRALRASRATCSARTRGRSICRGPVRPIPI